MGDKMFEEYVEKAIKSLYAQLRRKGYKVPLPVLREAVKRAREDLDQHFSYSSYTGIGLTVLPKFNLIISYEVGYTNWCGRTHGVFKITEIRAYKMPAENIDLYEYVESTDYIARGIVWCG